MTNDIENIRAQFPGLRRDVAYLDNAATTQMHQSAINAMNAYIVGGRSNVGRGLYPMAEETMSQYNAARLAVANFVGADGGRCVFTKSVTEGLNVIAFGLRDRLQPGDEILVSVFEHHANLLPWRCIAKERGAIVKTMPMLADFTLDLERAKAMMNDRTKIVAVTMMSNVLGAMLPIAELARCAHEVGAIIVVDAAQAAAHLPIDVVDLGVDALVFGSHKCYGPAGIAAMILSLDLIDSMEPMTVGGGMVDRVTADGATWRQGIEKFEGGSPNVEGAIGFAAALDSISFPDEKLRSRLVADLKSISGVTVFDPPGAVGIVSFTVNGMHPHDVADMLGQRGVCVRAGNHCAAPLVEKLSSTGTLRASLAMYTDERDIEALISNLKEIVKKGKV
ncbi:MAG: cysteine desulfurase [Patescibacteria group bacterium]